MSKSLSITLTSDDDITKKVSFKFVQPLIKSNGITEKTVAFILGVENEPVGHIEASLDEFNTFCIELAKVHKQIMKS